MMDVRAYPQAKDKAPQIKIMQLGLDGRVKLVLHVKGRHFAGQQV